MILCEVQQNSDLTYRLYDFHRVDAKGNPRDLHIEKGMAVIDFDHRKGGKVTPVAITLDQRREKIFTRSLPVLRDRTMGLFCAASRKF